jgi:hypothetical protein
MPTLQTVEAMRKRLGYDDIEVVNNAIETALQSATIACEDAVRTDLARATVKDRFFVIQPKDFRSGAIQTSLKLSRGFVDSGQTVSVVASTTMRNLLDSASSDRRNLVSPDDFTLLEAEKGILRVNEFDLTNCYVEVSYTAGFGTDGGCPEMYQTTGSSTLPAWLAEVAALKATLLLNGNPVVRRESLDETERETIQKQLDNILITQSRYAPGSWKVQQSAVTLV